MTQRTFDPWRRGAEAHYRNPAYYDRIYRSRRHDVDYYVRTAQERGGPVLELGCGSGRVALALARAGLQVVGVDALPVMIEHAERKRAKLPRGARERIRFVRGDLRRVRLDARFALILAPFNVLMHLYSRRDLERALETVRHHLRPRGRFVFDVLMPDTRSLTRDPRRRYRSGDVRDPDTGKRYRYAETFDYDPAQQVQTVRMIFESVEDGHVHVTPLTQRLFFPAELRALLHYNGFAVESHGGDFRQDDALYAEDESQVIMARAVRSRPR